MHTRRRFGLKPSAWSQSTRALRIEFAARAGSIDVSVA